MKKLDLQAVRKFESLELLAKQVVEGFITGLHKSPFHGFSVEFAEHKIYNKGESTRHIDWKLYARTEKLFTKRYEEETNLRCQIVIDHSSSMYYPDNKDYMNKIEFSVYVSAAIIELLKRQRDVVGLSLFSDTLDLHTQARSTMAHQKMLYSELEKLLTESPTPQQTSVAEALHVIAESTHKRSLVVIFSDMLQDNPDQAEEIFSALQHLKHNKHEVLLFNVVDTKTELDFEFENRPYTFIDKETGEQLKLHPNEIKESYLSQSKAYFDEIKNKCGQYHIDFIDADIRKGFDEVLLSYLVKRSKMN